MRRVRAFLKLHQRRHMDGLHPRRPDWRISVLVYGPILLLAALIMLCVAVYYGEM